MSSLNGSKVTLAGDNSQQMLLTNDVVQSVKTTNCFASILAIGTTNPSNAVYQSDFPDFYFRATNSEHMTDLKANFKRICEKSMVKKRYMYITEKILKENPNLCEYGASSLNTRQLIQATEIPKLGKEAAIKAIEEWRQPISKITHIIFCTTSPVDMPGPDYHLIRLLGLNPSVKRYMLPLQGCHAGGTALRLAKDLAENNQGARVLVVCSENTVMYFHGPSDEARYESTAAQAYFGDGAAAVIVGANPDESSNERPIFQLVSTAQTILPGSEGSLEGQLRELGLTHQITMNIPELISNNIDKALVEVFNPLGINDWNSIFWISHPGQPAILGKIESKLGLDEGKLNTARHVLSEFGNMSSATVLFVMDEMRKRSLKERKATTGDGLDWGVLFGFGPGFTVETIVLHSYPLHYLNN